MSGCVTTLSLGGLTFGGTATTTNYQESLSGRTLDNAGTATLACHYTGQGLTLSNGATLDNQNGASFTFTTDASVTTTASGGKLVVYVFGALAELMRATVRRHRSQLILSCFGRSDRCAQCDRSTLRTIRPKRTTSLAWSSDPDVLRIEDSDTGVRPPVTGSQSDSRRDGDLQRRRRDLSRGPPRKSSRRALHLFAGC
jgi:adhesin HecA-like repeat protein